MDYIERKKYLDKLKAFTDADFIKVLCGVRRSGKSSILQMYSKYLSEKCGAESVLEINMDSPRYFSIRTAEELNQIIAEKLTCKTRYILLDEVQLVDNWERIVNAYYGTKQYDITITGSNVILFSTELSSLLTGRYVSIDVFPLSYKEYLTFKTNGSFDDYVEYGGLPAIVRLEGEKERFDALQSTLNSILYTDVLRRNTGFKVPVLDSLVAYLNDSIGYPVSLNKLEHTLKSAKLKVYYELLTEYLKTLTNAYLFQICEPYHLKGKERFGAINKYYAIDTGFVNLTRNIASENYGVLLENIVYLELRRRGYSIVTGREEKIEVDFVARKGRDIVYYQVSESIIDRATRDREFRSLEAIDDNYPKLVLSMDTHDYSRDGILHRNIEKFLLE